MVTVYGLPTTVEETTVVVNTEMLTTVDVETEVVVTVKLTEDSRVVVVVRVEVVQFVEVQDFVAGLLSGLEPAYAGTAAFTVRTSTIARSTPARRVPRSG